MGIYLSYAHENDLPLMLAWRSNPLVYAGFFTQKNPLTWFEHYNWWTSRNKDWRTFLINVTDDVGSRPIGVVTVGQLDHWSPEIGYYIGDVSSWGNGYCKEAVKHALVIIQGMGKEYAHTTIKDDNERSIKLCTSLGFERLGNAREGESWYQKKLSE